MNRPFILKQIEDTLRKSFVAVLGQNDALVSDTIYYLFEQDIPDMVFLIVEPLSYVTDADVFFEMFLQSLEAQTRQKLDYTMSDVRQGDPIDQRIRKLFTSISDRFADLVIVVVIPALASVQDAPLRKLLLLLRDMGETGYCPNIRVLAYGAEKLWGLAYEGRQTPEISPFNRAVRHLIQDITVDELIDEGYDDDEAEDLLKASGNGVPALFVAHTETNEDTDEILRRLWAKVKHPSKMWLIRFASSNVPNYDYQLIEDPERCPVPSLDDREHVLRNAFWSGFLRMDRIPQWHITWRSPLHFDFVKQFVTTGEFPQARDEIAESPADCEKIKALSSNQLNVLRELAKGPTNKEIAQTLSYAPSTIKAMNYEIYQILDVTNRVEAAALYLRCKEYVDPDS